MTDQRARRRLVAGAAVALGIVIVVAAAVLMFRAGDPATCDLTAGDVGVLAEGLIRGDDAADIARSSEAGTFDGGACRDLMATMVGEPGADVSFDIDGTAVTIRGAQLTAIEIAGRPTCESWIADTLSGLCDAGTIDPPPALFGI